MVGLFILNSRPECIILALGLVPSEVVAILQYAPPWAIAETVRLPSFRPNSEGHKYMQTCLMNNRIIKVCMCLCVHMTLCEVFQSPCKSFIPARKSDESSIWK